MKERIRVKLDKQKIQMTEKTSQCLETAVDAAMNDTGKTANI